MTAPRPEEAWAAAIVEAVLHLTVRHHDDGSAPSMHDLDILDGQSIAGALEVTTVADAASIELWRLVRGHSGRLTIASIKGGWIIGLRPTTRAKQLMSALPGLLAGYECQGVNLVSGREHSFRDGVHDPRGAKLGITYARQCGTSYAGAVYLTVEQPREHLGGFVDEACEAVPEWLSRFLVGEDVADVRFKLQRSGAESRHAFLIFREFTGAPFDVVEPLLRPIDGAVPARDPTLREDITDVWLASTWAIGTGLRWSPSGR